MACLTIKEEDDESKLAVMRGPATRSEGQRPMFGDIADGEMELNKASISWLCAVPPPNAPVL